MKKKLLIAAGGLAVLGLVLVLVFPTQLTIIGGLADSFLRNTAAPQGTVETTTNPD